ncbi:hypothetical protein V1511DRAFT_489814 [Dipodascopsis uninucleata]
MYHISVSFHVPSSIPFCDHSTFIVFSFALTSAAKKVTKPTPNYLLFVWLSSFSAAFISVIFLSLVSLAAPRRFSLSGTFAARADTASLNELAHVLPCAVDTSSPRSRVRQPCSRFADRLNICSFRAVQLAALLVLA